MGTAHVRRVDVRIVSATNVDLEERIENGSFRLDLFYRLNVFTLRVPALRERVSEIPELVEHFFAARGFPRRMPIGEEALALFSRYAWPGNVRELENEVERIAVLHPRRGGDRTAHALGPHHAETARRNRRRPPPLRLARCLAPSVIWRRASSARRSRAPTGTRRRRRGGSGFPDRVSSKRSSGTAS